MVPHLPITINASRREVWNIETFLRFPKRGSEKGGGTNLNGGHCIFQVGWNVDHVWVLPPMCVTDRGGGGGREERGCAEPQRTESHAVLDQGAVVQGHPSLLHLKPEGHKANTIRHRQHCVILTLNSQTLYLLLVLKLCILW